MKLVVSIDDTDIAGGPGSGQLAERLSREICSLGLGRCGDIVRHQLLVHDDVPYTSHNSAMSFTVELRDYDFDETLRFGRDYLRRESADGSDPGFCAVVCDPHMHQEQLVAFGQRAKREVLDKGTAYGLAERLGVHLSEHGGTGDGVIGALAGAGLRLQGSDGRLRGWYRDCRTGEMTTVAELLHNTGAECAVTDDGRAVGGHEKVVFGDDRVKTVLQRGMRVIPLVKVARGGVQAMLTTLTKEEVKRF